MKKILVINCGSSSIKYEVFDAADFTMLASGLIEKIGAPDSRLHQKRRQDDGSFEVRTHTCALADHRAGFAFMAEVNQDNRIIENETELVGIGHRVVHGGEIFREPVRVDSSVIEAIRSLIPLAPLHNPANLLGIEVLRERFPAVPQVAVFDTAFHHSLPPYAYRYAVPGELYEKYQVRKYGFHGSSHAFVAKKAAQFVGKPLTELNLITLHLGNGASAAAIQGGKSIDTSMGMTPLEGLIMGTRCGDIDPSLPFFMMQQTGLSGAEVESLLNRKSGLHGLCGLSDMREIQGQAAAGNKQAQLAIDSFCYRIKKYIGAYCAIIGRLDALVFTGGIGENAPAIRHQVCQGLERMGIMVDRQKNESSAGEVGQIDTGAGSVTLLVIRTNEEREIAEQTRATIQRQE